MSSDRPLTTAHEPARVPSARAGSPSPAGAAGRRLAGFEIVAELGRGAASTVYRARRGAPSGPADPGDPDGTQEFALKILDWSAADSAEALTAFRREAALLASVDHPGLPRVHEIGVADGRPYLVMDLVDGVPLAEVLTAGPMPADRVIALGLDLIDPLTAVHRRGLVHRDLKPPNIMVRTDGEARLIDFGLTARGGGADAAGTAAPTAVGTLAYAAPEQFGMLKRPVDDRSDLYSLGVILFEALAGRLPFPTRDVGELLRMHAVTPAPDLAVVVPGTPSGLVELVARLLAKDPDDRYQDGATLATALRELAGGQPEPVAVRGTFVGGRDPLSGRIAELATLNRRWAAAHSGHGGAALVRGAGGSGKSSLVAEVAGQAGDAGWTVLRAKAAADDPVPFAPLRAAIEDYLQSIGRLPVAERRPRQARIRSVCAGWSAAMLGRLAPSLEAILTGRDSTQPAPGAGPGEQDSADGSDGQNQFPAAVAGFLAALAREFAGLMLVLDDVQALDPGTLRVLTHLAPDLARTPLLLLATARDDGESADPADQADPADRVNTADRADTAESAGRAGLSGFRTALAGTIDVDLVLGPLEADGVADQLQALMPGLSIDPHLVDLLYVRSNGNPFVVQEYLRAIVDAGLLRPSWGSWVLDEQGLDALELPQDAVGLVLARVHGLGPEVRELLTIAAAMGSRFQAGAVAAVAGLELDVVLQALVGAARRRLIEPRDGGEFAFLHDRIREALLAELDPGGLADLHGRIAAALEELPDGGRQAERVFAIAHHYLRSGPGADPGRVFAACWAAGKLALANHAPGEAVLLLEHAGGLGNKNPSGFLLLLGTAFQQAGRLDEARDRLEQALLVETALVRRAEIFTLLANVYRSNWNTDAAQATIDRGLAEIGARLPGNPVTLWLSTLLMFLVAMFRQRTRIGFGSATGLRRDQCHTIAAMHEVGSYLGVISMRPDLVLIHNMRSLYWANQLGPGRRYALSQGSFGLVWEMAGLHRTSRRYFARADADPASANPAVQAITAHYRGAAQFLGGRENGQLWIDCTEANGRWLDVATFLDAVAVFNLTACTEGRTREAEYWLAQGQRRLGAMGGDVTSFISAEPMTNALLGRSGDAGAGLRRMTELCAGNQARSLAVVRLVATFFVLGEQGEIGDPFEQAVSEFKALKLKPAAMLRMHRIIQYLIATGRLAQLRSADPVQRPARLLAARQAVRQVEKVAGPDELKTRALLARADLLVLENEPARALELLVRVPQFHTPDAPTLSFELARVRARALIALGHEEGRRQARQASSIALDQGWAHRSAAITAEFGVTAGERGGSPASATQAATFTHTGTYAGTFAGGMERQRLQALQEVSAAASRVLDPGELARIALDETIRILAADRAFLFLTDDETGGLIAHLGRDAAGNDVPELTGYSTTLVERVRVTGQPLVVTGTEEGAALGAESVVLHGLRSILVAPLQLEGRVLGVVYLDSQVAKGIFTAQDAGILTALTNHIATSLETARAAQMEISMQTARKQRDLADILMQTLQFVSDTLDPGEVVRRLLAAAASLLEADGVWLISLTADVFTRMSLDGASGELIRTPVADEPRLRALVARDQPAIGDPLEVPSALETELAEAESWISVPMRIHDGRIGALVVATTRLEINLGGVIEVAAMLGASATTAYDKAALFQRVQELAVVDELTGIANRRRFFEVAARDLAAAARHGRPLTVLMIDIDHFKRVNDSYGHATGDDVIREVAGRLAGRVRQTDVLGRYGGEEFALLLQDAGPGSVLPERLRASIAEEKIATRSGELSITVSIGLAHLGPDEDDIVSLLDRADKELYRAKSLGRNQVCGE